MTGSFLDVTERGGERVTRAQLERFYQRYGWAGEYCKGKDVLELACGTGPGLGHLLLVASSLRAGDVSDEVLAVARAHYGDRVRLDRFDASNTPFADASFDVVILFEAIYYLQGAAEFIDEMKRILRPGGAILLATANKDLFDFNPSPFAKAYYNPPELGLLLSRRGFKYSFFGGSPVRDSGLAANVLRFVKRTAVSLGIMPRSMRGKRWLKRIFMGRLVEMPRELTDRTLSFQPPTPIPDDMPDHIHQVLYCAAFKE